MRLAVYSDFPYRRLDGRLYADEAFVLFLDCLTEQVDELVLLGRLHPSGGRSHFPVAPSIAFVGLPYYGDLARPFSAAGAILRTVGPAWRAMRNVDGILAFGPHPFALIVAGIARLRRKGAALGVRQDFPRYVRARHPGRRTIHWAASVLERLFRAAARTMPVVAVGEQLASHYGGAQAVLPLLVSLVRESDVVAYPVDRAGGRDVQILSVGRLDPEKNPVLLADVLARLNRQGDRWRLVVCGEGSLRRELEQRVRQLGLTGRVELRGYVPHGPALRRLYEESDVLLHVSWTEGVPQVLLEAFAAGLPVVATAVGGVPALVGDAALLVPPGDGDAAAGAVARVTRDAALRRSIVDRGLVRVRVHTAEHESAQLVEFLRRHWDATPGPVARSTPRATP